MSDVIEFFVDGTELRWRRKTKTGQVIKVSPQGFTSLAVATRSAQSSNKDIHRNQFKVQKGLHLGKR